MAARDKEIELARGEIQRDVVRKAVDKYQQEINHLTKQRQALSMDSLKLVLKISEIIDTFNNLVSIYLKAPFEGKAEIIRSITDGVIIRDDEAGIIWKEPYSILLKPEILELNKKTDESACSNSSIHAGPEGLEPPTLGFGDRCSTS